MGSDPEKYQRQEDEPVGEYKEYRYRYAVLAVYTLATMSGAILWIVLSPISEQVSKIYGVSGAVVDTNTLLFMLMYLPTGFISNYIMDRYSLAWALRFAMLCLLVCSWLHLLIDANFYLLFVGTVIGGMGNPFFLNAPAKIAALWFKPDARALATTIGSMANPLGTLIGLVLPNLFVNKHVVNKGHGKSAMVDLILLQAILTTVIAVLFFLVFRERPPTPPSLTSVEHTQEPFFASCKSLLRNRKFQPLLFCSTIIIGVANATSTLIDQLVHPYGYSSADSGLIGVILLLAGMISSIFIGAYVSKSRRFKRTIVILLWCSSILGLSLYGAFATKSLAFVLILAALTGLCILPLYPLLFELACESTYPIGEALNVGMLMFGGQAFGIILTYIGGSLIGSHSSLGAGFLFSGLQVGAVLVIMMTFKQKLIRSEMEGFVDIDAEEQDSGEKIGEGSRGEEL